MLDVLQAFQEVEVPHGAAELAVGDGLQARPLLLLHQVCDGGVLGSGQLLAGDGSGGEIGARLLEGLGAQEAADDVICVGRVGDGHGWRPFIACVARERMPQACVIENYRFGRDMHSQKEWKRGWAARAARGVGCRRARRLVFRLRRSRRASKGSREGELPYSPASRWYSFTYSCSSCR